MSLKLLVENYQSIAGVEFEASGFTVIVGESDIGKSALIRSVVGLLTNGIEAAGIRRGAGKCHVKLEAVGRTFEVERTASTSVYWVDGHKEVKLGGKPHPGIVAAGFGELKVSDEALSPLWVSDQFEPLFLLSRKASVAAGVFTQATRLDVVSKAAREAAVEVKRTRSTLEGKEGELKTATGLLSSLSDVPRIGQAARTLVSQKERISKELDFVDVLSDMLVLILLNVKVGEIFKGHQVSVTASLSGLEGKVLEFSRLEELQNKLRKVSAAGAALASMEGLVVADLASTEKLVGQLTALKEAATKSSVLRKSVLLLKDFKVIPPTEETLVDVGVLSVSFSDLSTVNSALVLCKKEESELIKEKERIEKELADVNDELKNLSPGDLHCPDCGFIFEGLQVDFSKL